MDCSTRRLLIVDDSDNVRQSLAYVISLYEDLVVVGTASNGQEACVLCSKLEPNIVLMDVKMPVMDGIEATAQIRKLPISVRVILMTQVYKPEAAEAAYQAGAFRYISKGSWEDLHQVILEACEA